MSKIKITDYGDGEYLATLKTPEFGSESKPGHLDRRIYLTFLLQEGSDVEEGSRLESAEEIPTHELNDGFCALIKKGGHFYLRALRYDGLQMQELNLDGIGNPSGVFESEIKQIKDIRTLTKWMTRNRLRAL